MFDRSFHVSASWHAVFGVHGAVMLLLICTSSRKAAENRIAANTAAKSRVAESRTAENRVAEKRIARDKGS